MQYDVIIIGAGHNGLTTFTLIPPLQEAADNYNVCRRGEIPDRLWVDCVLASNADDTFSPNGRNTNHLSRNSTSAAQELTPVVALRAHRATMRQVLF